MIKLKIIHEFWIFIWGNIFFRIMYDRKYLSSKYFKTKYLGIGAIGWRWTISDFMGRFLLNTNRGTPFPVSPKNVITNPHNIYFDVDDINNFQGFGNYFQAIGDARIFIGKGSWIAPNVGLITTNHDQNDLSKHTKGKDIIIGEDCWIGMNSIILPGVELGKRTIVGAGSVVTKSFAEGNCTIAGNPAKVINNSTDIN